jgi:hypothetical protein
MYLTMSSEILYILAFDSLPKSAVLHEGLFSHIHITSNIYQRVREWHGIDHNFQDGLHVMSSASMCLHHIS